MQPALATTPEAPTFRDVFESEVAFMWSTLRRLGVAERELEDVTHEVFVIVHRRLADYDPSRPLRPWLFGIAQRVASDWRRLARHRHETLEEPAEPPDSRPCADAAIAERQRRTLLAAALDTLDEGRRAVLVAHDLEDCAMPEIATALGIPLATAYSRLRVAREDLARAIKRPHRAQWRCPVSEHDLLPIDPVLSALYEAERHAPEISDAARASLRASFAPLFGGSGPSAPPSAGGSPHGPPAATRPSPAHGSSATSILPRLLRTAAVFASGAAIGAVVHGAVVPRGPVAIETAPRELPSVVPVASGSSWQVVPTGPGASAAASAVPTAAPASPQPPTTVVLPARSGVSADSRDTGLATERTLIETARSALARRDGVAVLQAVDRHAALFPSGQLAEEREALAVQALVITGRADEARARADRFRQRFPNGLYRPIVDAALLTISR